MQAGQLDDPLLYLHPTKPSQRLRTHLLPSWKLEKLTLSSELALSLAFNYILAPKRLASFRQPEDRRRLRDSLWTAS